MNHVLTSVSRIDRRWLTRLGAIGFWFFLAKGLLWLITPLLFYLAL